MKKSLLLLCLAALCGGCVDQDYDLKKIDDEITIGNDESEFVAPLAKITISMQELQNDTSDIQSIFSEMDIWLPTTLPGGATSIEIPRMTTDEDYLDALFQALVDEMLVSESPKMDAVMELLWNTPGYLSRLSDQLPTESKDLFEAAFRLIFTSNDAAADQLRATVRQMVSLYLDSIHIAPIVYSMPLDLGDEVEDLLSQNLDPEGTPNPTRYIDLFGTVRSEFPVSFDVNPVFTEANVTVTPFNVEPNIASPIPDTRFYREGLQSLLDNFAFEVSFTPQRYYPATGSFDQTQSISIQLNLRKKGGLGFTSDNNDQ